jgi:hypothetical protein
VEESVLETAGLDVVEESVFDTAGLDVVEESVLETAGLDVVEESVFDTAGLDVVEESVLETAGLDVVEESVFDTAGLDVVEESVLETAGLDVVEESVFDTAGLDVEEYEETQSSVIKAESVLETAGLDTDEYEEIQRSVIKTESVLEPAGLVAVEYEETQSCVLNGSKQVWVTTHSKTVVVEDEEVAVVTDGEESEEESQIDMYVGIMEPKETESALETAGLDEVEYKETQEWVLSGRQVLQPIHSETTVEDVTVVTLGQECEEDTQRKTGVDIMKSDNGHGPFTGETSAADLSLCYDDVDCAELSNHETESSVPEPQMLFTMADAEQAWNVATTQQCDLLQTLQQPVMLSAEVCYDDVSVDMLPSEPVQNQIPIASAGEERVSVNLSALIETQQWFAAEADMSPAANPAMPVKSDSSWNTELLQCFHTLKRSLSLMLQKLTLRHDKPHDSLDSSVDADIVETVEEDELSCCLPSSHFTHLSTTHECISVHSDVSLSGICNDIRAEAANNMDVRLSGICNDIGAEAVNNMDVRPANVAGSEGITQAQAQAGPSWRMDASECSGQSLLFEHLQDLWSSWHLLCDNLQTWAPASKCSKSQCETPDGREAHEFPGTSVDGEWCEARSLMNQHLWDLVGAWLQLLNTFGERWFLESPVESLFIDRHMQSLRTSSSVLLEHVEHGMEDMLGTGLTASNQFFRELRFLEHSQGQPIQHAAGDFYHDLDTHIGQPVNFEPPDGVCTYRLHNLLSLALQHLQDLFNSFLDLLCRLKELWLFEDGEGERSEFRFGRVVLGGRRGSLLYEHIMDMRRSWSAACFSLWQTLFRAEGRAEGEVRVCRGRFGHTVAVREARPPEHNRTCLFRGSNDDTTQLFTLCTTNSIAELVGLLTGLIVPILFGCLEDDPAPVQPLPGSSSSPCRPVSSMLRDRGLAVCREPFARTSTPGFSSLTRAQNNKSICDPSTLVIVPRHGSWTRTHHNRRRTRRTNVVTMCTNGVVLSWTEFCQWTQRRIMLVSAALYRRLLGFASIVLGRSGALFYLFREKFSAVKSCCCERSAAFCHCVQAKVASLAQSERMTRFRRNMEWLADVLTVSFLVCQARFCQRFPRIARFIANRWSWLVASVRGVVWQVFGGPNQSLDTLMPRGLVEDLMSGGGDCNIADDLALVCEDQGPKGLVAALVFGFAILTDVVSASCLPDLCTSAPSHIHTDEVVAAVTLSPTVIQSLGSSFKVAAPQAQNACA